MIKKKNVFYVFLLLAFFLISLKFDIQIMRFFSMIRTYYLTQFLYGIAFLSSEIIIFFVLTSLFLFNEGKRKWVFPLWVTMFFSVIIGFLLKIIFQRARPFEIGVISSLVVEQFSWWNYSFPSFQSMLVFSALPILYKEFPRLKYFWLAFAGLVAFSRVYIGVHFLSDVIAGALIGLGIGMFIVHKENRNKTWSKLYKNLFNKR